MNIPKESMFIPLQNETEFNIIAQKIMIQQSLTEKLFIGISNLSKIAEMSHPVDHATSEIFSMGKPLKG